MTFLPKNLSQPRTYSYIKRKSNFFYCKDCWIIPWQITGRA